MRGSGLLLFSSLLVCACAAPPERYGENHPTPYNVVLVTIDGVRWQEFFAGADPLQTADAAPIFPRFAETLSWRGQQYGDLRAGSEMVVSTNANASLPGYMSIFAEHPQGCMTNGCGRISVPTFVDRLHDELLLEKKDQRVVATWAQVGLAVSARDEVANVHAGRMQLPEEDEPHTHQLSADDALEFDHGTIARGFDALAQKPRFLYLSLLDSDRFGHQNNYPRYLEVLRTYDRMLVELVERLQSMGEYGERTAVVLTTDHGRGVWDQWAEHGPHVPVSANVFAWVMVPPASAMQLESATARRFTHHDVRYTIETVFGLATAESAGASTGFIAR